MEIVAMMATAQRITHAARRLRVAEAQADDLRRALRDEVKLAIDDGSMSRRQIATACGMSWPAAYGCLDHADRQALAAMQAR